MHVKVSYGTIASVVVRALYSLVWLVVFIVWMVWLVVWLVGETWLVQKGITDKSQFPSLASLLFVLSNVRVSIFLIKVLP